MSSFETLYTEEDVCYYESLPVEKILLDQVEDEIIDLHNDKIDKQAAVDTEVTELGSRILQDEKDLENTHSHIHDLQMKICKSCRQLQEAIHEIELEATTREQRISMNRKAMRYKEMISDVIEDEIDREGRHLRIIKDKIQYPDETPVYPYPRPSDGAGSRDIGGFFNKKRYHSSIDLAHTTTGKPKRLRAPKDGTEEKD